MALPMPKLKIQTRTQSSCWRVKPLVLRKDKFEAVKEDIKVYTAKLVEIVAGSPWLPHGYPALDPQFSWH